MPWAQYEVLHAHALVALALELTLLACEQLAVLRHPNRGSNPPNHSVEKAAVVVAGAVTVTPCQMLLETTPLRIVALVVALVVVLVVFLSLVDDASRDVVAVFWKVLERRRLAETMIVPSSNAALEQHADSDWISLACDNAGAVADVVAGGGGADSDYGLYVWQ